MARNRITVRSLASIPAVKADEGETTEVQVSDAPVQTGVVQYEDAQAPETETKAPEATDEADEDEEPGHIDAPEVKVDTPDADLPARIGLIYTSKASVKANNKTLAKMFAELGERILTQTASTIFHAAKHGDAGLLNNFYNIVPASQQQSFKEWIVRYVKADYPADTKPSNLWIGMSKEKGLFVRQGCQDDRNKFLARCGDDAINNVKAFNWTEEAAESIKNPFDDADLAAMLGGLLKRAQGDKAAVSATQVQALKDAIAAFEKGATVSIKDADEIRAARKKANAA